MTVVDARSNVCSLCEDGLAGLKYPHAVIRSDGTTCTGMALEVAMNYEGDQDDCYKALEGWRQICCGDEKPLEVAITEPVLTKYPDIDSIEVVGKYSKCDVCRDGDYPSASSMVINMLYVGEGSCPQYWKAGQEGLIPKHLCAPLQYFAYEPCGCGEFSTDGNYNWGNSYSGDTPNSNNKDDDDDDDEEPWWASANGANQGDDEERPWWAGADSMPSSSAAVALLQQPVSLILLLLFLGMMQIFVV